MDKSNLKNIVVLKNLPSNIVDEAIIILKPNNKIKKLEIVDKNKSSKTINNQKSLDKHVLKEAEMLVADYILKAERKEKKKNSNNMLKQKYNRLKKYALISSLILVVSIIANFV